MNQPDFLSHLQKDPDTVQFSDCIEFIDSHYHFTPTAFMNGELKNAAGENNGSCKIFAFGQLHKLSEQSVLACFGEHYRNVLENPEATDHQNIRQFMSSGWNGIQFSVQALQPKSP